MKYLYVIAFIIATVITATAFAADPEADNPLSPRELELLENCNLEARNSLIHEDLELVKNICTEAIENISKSHKDDKFIINPLMNLAFSYSLAGHFDKAEPIYDRALKIGKKSFPADSRKLRKITDVIKASENMKKEQSK